MYLNRFVLIVQTMCSCDSQDHCKILNTRKLCAYTQYLCFIQKNIEGIDYNDKENEDYNYDDEGYNDCEDVENYGNYCWDFDDIYCHDFDDNTFCRN